jgi:hypothetical protein
MIECLGSTVTLKVVADDAQTFVNGSQVSQSTVLHHVSKSNDDKQITVTENGMSSGYGFARHDN